jgi:hypothetical protein
VLGKSRHRTSEHTVFLASFIRCVGRGTVKEGGTSRERCAANAATEQANRTRIVDAALLASHSALGSHSNEKGGA